MQAGTASPPRERLREDSKVEALKKLAQKIQKATPDEGAGMQALMDAVEEQDSSSACTAATCDAKLTWKRLVRLCSRLASQRALDGRGRASSWASLRVVA
jgi:hypothetical protein